MGFKEILKSVFIKENNNVDKVHKNPYLTLIINQLSVKYNMSIFNIDDIVRIGSISFIPNDFLESHTMSEIVDYFTNNNTAVYVSGILHLDLINKNIYTVTVETSELYNDPEIIFCKIN